MRSEMQGGYALTRITTAGSSRIVAGVNAMESRVAKYRNLAVEAADRARRTDDLESRRAWLKIANNWTSLATDAENISGKSAPVTSPTRDLG